MERLINAALEEGNKDIKISLCDGRGFSVAETIVCRRPASYRRDRPAYDR